MSASLGHSYNTHRSKVRLRPKALTDRGLHCGECSACPVCAHVWLTLVLLSAANLGRSMTLLQVEYPEIRGPKSLDSGPKINLDHLHIYNLGPQTQNLPVLCTPTPLSPEPRILQMLETHGCTPSPLSCIQSPTSVFFHMSLSDEPCQHILKTVCLFESMPVLTAAHPPVVLGFPGLLRPMSAFEMLPSGVGWL